MTQFPDKQTQKSNGKRSTCTILAAPGSNRLGCLPPCVPPSRSSLAWRDRLSSFMLLTTITWCRPHRLTTPEHTHTHTHALTNHPSRLVVHGSRKISRATAIIVPNSSFIQRYSSFSSSFFHLCFKFLLLILLSFIPHSAMP